MSMLIEVWGDYACFTRPEMKTERVSYDMITPSAARGLVEAIYWHPGLRYTVDRIYLLKPFGLDPEDEASTEEYTQRPIRFTNIRRNEVKSTLLSSAALSAAKGGTPPVRTGPPPATTPASFRTSCADVCARDSAITSPVSGAGSSQPTSGNGRAEASRPCLSRRTSASCSTASITLIRPTSAASSSAQSWWTA